MKRIEKKLKTITDKLREAGVATFNAKSCYPQYNARQNLSGKTHYYDDDTIKFFKTIVSNCRVINDLLIVVLESNRYHNDARFHRVRVFNIFGGCLDDHYDKKFTARQAKKIYQDTVNDYIQHPEKILEITLRAVEAEKKSQSRYVKGLNRIRSKNNG